MVDEARCVTAATAVYDAAVIEAEEIGMVERAVCVCPVLRFVPLNSLTLIFNDALAGRDHVARKNAGAVDSGGFDNVQRWQGEAGSYSCCDWIW